MNARIRLEEVPEVRELEQQVKSSADPDSIRFLLAIACRNTGTLEGRLKAYNLFLQIRRRYYDDPRYHLELARTYLEGERRSDAREEFRKAVKLDPSSATARLGYARLLLRSALRFREAGTALEGLEVLDAGLAVAPGNREMLLQKSIFCCLARELDSRDRGLHSAVGYACADSITRRDERDVTAWLLAGVHLLDLGDPEAADGSFRTGLTAAPAALKEAYVVPAYQAPETTLARIRSLPGPRAVDAIRAYWERMDPTPLTAVNESQLEYWKRLTLADAYYGEPELHGWETPRGEVLVRYGSPGAIRYEQASFDLGSADVQEDTKLNLRKAHVIDRLALDMLYPTQTWEYTFNGRTLEFAFVDRSLRDKFENAAPAAVEVARADIPSVTFGADPGTVRACFIAGSGSRKPDGRTRETVHVAVPSWGSGADWWKGASVKITLIDGNARPSVLAETVLRPEMTARMYRDAGRMAFVDGSLTVDPGRYTVSVDVTAPDRRGTFALPLTVRSYAGDSLYLSDLRLALPEAAPAGETGARVPNPGGIVPAEGRVLVLFEIYNLQVGAEEEARYRMAYTVLPRAWALAWSREVATLDPALRFGRMGASLGGVTLTGRNFARLEYPENTLNLAPRATGTGSFLVDATGLDPGEYALLVTVTDVRAGRSATEQIPFRVLSDEDFRLIFAEE